MSAITTDRFDQIAREECAAIFSGSRYMHAVVYYRAVDAGDLRTISEAAAWYEWPEERVRAVLIRYWSMLLEVNEAESRLKGWLKAMSSSYDRDIKVF